MKSNLFRLICLLNLCISIPAFGQISITASQFPQPIGVDTLSSTINVFSFPEPTHGVNQFWDYSSLLTPTTSYTQMFRDTNHPVFNSANHQRKEFYSLQNFTFRAHDHFEWEESGLTWIGRSQFDSTFSINDLTGGTEDEVSFTEEDIRFSPRKMIQLPLQYTDSWADLDTQYLRFEVTIIASNLNKAPVDFVSFQHHQSEVVGWGQLQLPPVNGVPSAPKEALLLLRTDSVIDSIFVMGAPAPTQFLSGFGATQGQTNVTKEYEFYVLGFGQPAISVSYNPQTNDQITFRPRAAKATPISVADYKKDLVEVAIFPTLLRSGETLKIHASHSVGQISLIDTQGKVILSEPSNTQITTLPLAVPAGLYVLRVSDQKGKFIQQQKVVVVD